MSATGIVDHLVRPHVVRLPLYPSHTLPSFLAGCYSLWQGGPPMQHSLAPSQHSRPPPCTPTQSCCSFFLLFIHLFLPLQATTEDKYLLQPSSASESFLPSNMPLGVARIVNNILALFEARTMAEHCRPMPIMSRDVVWDAPPFLLR